MSDDAYRFLVKYNKTSGEHKEKKRNEERSDQPHRG